MDTLASERLSAENALPHRSADQLQGSIHNFSKVWKNTSSFGFDNYYTSKIEGTSEVGNIFLLRGMLTNTRHAIRATLPVVSVSTPAGNVSGLGNFNILDVIRITKESANIHFGLGPFISVPTRTSSVLGVAYMQFGISTLIAHAMSSGVILGALVTYRNSIHQFSQRGGYLTIQPAFVVNLGYGFYARNLGATLVFDFMNNKTIVPVGLGIGKLVKLGQAIGNIYIEPGYTVYSKGEKMPAMELLLGMNFIWLKKSK